MTDDEYRKLQSLLANHPTIGAVIPGSGGLRKVRWGLRGRGKQGGVRVIYYWAARQAKLLMLLVYPKNERDDLSAEQLRVLRSIVEKEFHES
ncbi:MAG: type II toxin-antitoxin system RelE/ParE family toxin [Anaerolineales bacterium]|nr:type II toxin-antitoxin system RelE/ParE family toxin [Anaerolineales bacterium]